ncbi:MAG: ACP S-malonyltransferase, partial [Spirochaetes bacterium]|nr:ACP S-malonyltransferase [Spirochaetota bacterium]
AGFSLGEYTALSAAGHFDFETGVQLVRERGLIMDQAVVGIAGGMAAILGLDDEIVEDVCQQTDGIVVPVNYNCPGQLVISGEKKAVENACKLAEEKGAMRTVILNVSGPFHSPLLQKGSEKLKEYLSELRFTDSQSVKVVANVTADYYPQTGVKDILVKQMHSPVQWRKSMELLIKEGYQRFIEVGPGKTLRGFMRSIDRKQKVFNVNSVDSLEKTIIDLKN